MKTRLLTSSFITILTLAAYTTTGAMAYAQQAPRKTAEERAKSESDKMKEQLALSDSRYKKVSEINLRYAKNADSTLSENQDRRVAFQQIQAQQKEKNKEFKAIFTKEQYKAYEIWLEELKVNARSQMQQRRQRIH